MVNQVQRQDCLLRDVSPGILLSLQTFKVEGGPSTCTRVMTQHGKRTWLRQLTPRDGRGCAPARNVALAHIQPQASSPWGGRPLQPGLDIPWSPLRALSSPGRG